jgi:hypothetical protein
MVEEKKSVRGFHFHSEPSFRLLGQADSRSQWFMIELLWHDGVDFVKRIPHPQPAFNFMPLFQAHRLKDQKLRAFSAD